MANTSLLQVRTDPADREKAVEILEALGTNLSAVVNMLIKQIIITKGIPFEVKLDHPAYSIEDSLEETKATMALERMALSQEEMRILRDYANGTVSGDELRRQIYASVTDTDRMGIMESE